ncbi:MAG: hypothetical protein SVM79_05085 [Chloroflexota bacterium]|nr:hypothetical protein [Chloroflexota bacterium]
MYESIRFEGEEGNRKGAIRIVDEVLQENGNFGVYGDFSSGLLNVLEDFSVTISEEKEKYVVEIYQKNSGAGHDFSFEIDKNTMHLSNLVIGAIEPPPSF